LALLFAFLAKQKLLTAKGAEKSLEGAEKTLVIFRQRVTGLSDTALAKFVARASRAVKLRGLVNVLVTGSRELRSLNRRFRGQDKPTDVLSFLPSPDFGNGLAGDIAISAEIAKQNARLLGHSAAQEIKILALHGVLHLAGYDHESDHGRMAGKEVDLRRALGLPAGLIERNERAASKGTRARAAGARATQAAAELRSARTGPFDVAQGMLRPVPTQSRARTQVRSR
jgi:probable rRNA maturation factor